MYQKKHLTVLVSLLIVISMVTPAFATDTYGGVLLIDTIKTYLQNGYPIYASNSVNGSSTNHHATVIRGVDTTNGYISLMDPEIANSYVTASMAWVSGVLTFKYTSPASNTTQVVIYCGYPS